MNDFFIFEKSKMSLTWVIMMDSLFGFSHLNEKMNKQQKVRNWCAEKKNENQRKKWAIIYSWEKILIQIDSFVLVDSKWFQWKNVGWSIVFNERKVLKKKKKEKNFGNCFLLLHWKRDYGSFKK